MVDADNNNDSNDGVTTKISSITDKAYLKQKISLHKEQKQEQMIQDMKRV